MALRALYSLGGRMALIESVRGATAAPAACRLPSLGSGGGELTRSGPLSFSLSPGSKRGIVVASPTPRMFSVKSVA
jgi:hypothetical protein